MTKRKAKIAITTLGCKVNQYESAGIIGELSARGFDIVPYDTPADIYVVNSCTVTEKTDYQSRQLIKRANRLNPLAMIIVTGCYAQIAPEKVSQLSGVKIVAGSSQKENLPDIIERLLTDSSKPELEPLILPATTFTKGFNYNLDTHLPDHTRAFLKIQDGCDSYCSYCIVPYARGRSRSLEPHSVVSRLSALVAAGFKEVVLTGIHLGTYGLDLENGLDLLSLLRRIEDDVPSLIRLRLSSIEPTEITDDLINHMAQSRILCRHFHIPLQSGSNKILTDMRRCYNNQQFKTVIDKIVRAIPGAAVGIDVMAGFPGEEDRDFTDTVDFVAALPVAYLHVFPYSKRMGTAAADFTHQINERTKKERASILRKIGQEKRRSFCSRFIGKTLSVLIESKPDEITSHFKGFSDNYMTVFITDTANRELSGNQIVKAFVTSASEDKLYGRIFNGRQG